MGEKYPQDQSELIKIRTDDEYNKLTEDGIQVAFASKLNITKEDLKRLVRSNTLSYGMTTLIF